MPDYDLQFPVMKYAGKHLLIEFWDVLEHLLRDETAIEPVLIQAAHAAKATVLHKYFHHFGEGYGVTGTIILAESHITIHTWPELKYAALDIFMCGKCNPEHAIPTLLEEFMPKSHKITEALRGVH